MAAWKLFSALTVASALHVPALSDELLHFKSNVTNHNLFTVEARIAGSMESMPLQLDGTVIDGFLDLPASFLDNSSVQLTNVATRGFVTVPIQSLRSKVPPPNGGAIEQRMKEVLLADQHPNLVFVLKKLNREAPSESSSAGRGTAYGDMIVAGVTNSAEILFTTDRKPAVLVVRGKGSIDAPAFKIYKIAPHMAHFRVRDEVRFSFEWSLTQAPK